ncbi:Protein ACCUMULATION AND REPLICATION OF CHLOROPLASTS 3 [Platanthera zijinensis]|uniref:Protein ACCUMULATION AND REPLICATION OF CHLOROPLASTS 3 n=1 Tax=Platanthera zijinensis TaxID=2320716 RepID=A0AAP0BQK1_9ASPA
METRADPLAGGFCETSEAERHNDELDAVVLTWDYLRRETMSNKISHLQGRARCTPVGKPRIGSRGSGSTVSSTIAIFSDSGHYSGELPLLHLHRNLFWDVETRHQEDVSTLTIKLNELTTALLVVTTSSTDHASNSQAPPLILHEPPAFIHPKVAMSPRYTRLDFLTYDDKTDPLVIHALTDQPSLTWDDFKRSCALIAGFGTELLLDNAELSQEAERGSPKGWNSIVEIPYRGGIYRGRCQGGLPDGKGRLTSMDGSFYEGFWKCGKRSGLGTFCHSNGDLFRGPWRDDVMHGKEFTLCTLDEQRIGVAVVLLVEGLVEGWVEEVAGGSMEVGCRYVE